MLSPTAENAIECSLKARRALLKFLSANDVRRLESHQFGPLLPKQCWTLFTPHSPERGINKKTFPKIEWWDGTVTNSCVTWYGKAKSEYRLTCFGRNFPHLTTCDTGSLLVLVPHTYEQFSAFILDLEEDIEGILQALDVEVLETWGGSYQHGRVAVDPGTCISAKFRAFIGPLEGFPSTTEISHFTYQCASECLPDFHQQSPDDQLLELIRLEYELFQKIETVLCSNEIQGRLFKSVGEFIATALGLLNRRKSRAGRALENHFGRLLNGAGIPFESRAAVQGRPDVLIPSKEVYESDDHSHLFVVGVKTTCKDRWRQILHEAPRVRHRYLLTLQQGVSEAQFSEMVNANVQLIVPSAFHNHYPKSIRARLLTISEFFEKVKAAQQPATESM